jgi:hypothetical protein
MSQRLLETDFPLGQNQQKPASAMRRSASRDRPPPLNLTTRPLSTTGSMPKNITASEWQYEPSLAYSRTGSMSRVQTSFGSNPTGRPVVVTTRQQSEGGAGPTPAGGGVVGRTGSLRRAFTTTSDEEEADECEEETRPLHSSSHVNRQPLPPSQRPRPQITTASTVNNSQSSTSDYHSDENPNLLPQEHRDLPPSFRLQNNFNR